MAFGKTKQQAGRAAEQAVNDAKGRGGAGEAEGMLSDLGRSEVVSAPSADKALALVDGQLCDIALLDMS